MTDETIMNQPRDRDTLGGRISRAREALGMELEEAAERVGVTLETYEIWENDRDEPRANKLVMLAGVLSVSASWLLHGIGESPSFETISEEVENLKTQLSRLQEMHIETGNALGQIELAIERLRSS